MEVDDQTVCKDPGLATVMREEQREAQCLNQEDYSDPAMLMIGGCSIEHCVVCDGQMYSWLILKTLILRLQSNQHFKENDQSRTFIEVC